MPDEGYVDTKINPANVLWIAAAVVLLLAAGATPIAMWWFSD